MSASALASTDLEKALVFQYLEWNQRFLQSKTDKAEQRKLLRILSADLQGRTYLTGFVLKAIDFLIADSIKELLTQLTFEEKEGICEVLRWYTHVQRQAPNLPYISFQRFVLAPMVRVSTHPMRLLALRYGATYVYTEEIIDFKLLRTTRVENAKLGTVDFVHPDGTVVFRTSAEEKGKVILQLGTADAKRALEAAKRVEKDVAAIDVNMGCPKEYSIKGGMGAALLKKPEVVREILTTLVNNLSIPVTCKIRIPDNLEDTIALAKVIESTGVAALAVHGRRRCDRPSDPNREDVIRAITGAIKTPVLASGGSKSIIRLHEDIEFFRQLTGAAGVMIGRAAMWNPAIFSEPPKDHQPPSRFQLLREYIELAVKYDHHITGTKYCLQRMLNEDTTIERYDKTLTAARMTEVCEIWGLSEEVCELAKQCTDDRVLVSTATATTTKDAVGTDIEEPSLSEVKRPRLGEVPAEIDRAAAADPDAAVVVLPIGFVRSDWPGVGDTPKQLLVEYCKKKQLEFPTYTVVEDKETRTFTATALVDGNRYSHTIPSKSKRYAEQAAALACLEHLGVHSLPQKSTV
ncbi:hypothetical protein AAHC03_025909 [Spirometra sp. Aus1]